MSQNPITGKDKVGGPDTSVGGGGDELDLSGFGKNVGVDLPALLEVKTGDIAAHAVTDAKATGQTASASNKAAIYFPRVACAVYDFSVDGGAQGQITPVSTVTIPAGSVILGASLKVSTAVTSAGAATLSADLISAADLVAATAKASLADDAVVAGKVAPDANPLVTVADTTVKVTVATADLTAGVVEIIVLYACGVEGAT